MKYLLIVLLNLSVAQAAECLRTSELQTEIGFLDLELKARLDEADQNLNPLDRAKARLILNEMCQAQEQRTKYDVNRAEIRHSLQKLYDLLDEKIGEQRALVSLPLKERTVEGSVREEVGGVTQKFKGWIRAELKIGKNKLSVRKHIFSIWNPRCYSEAKIESRTQVTCEDGE